jgi:hypothetical protein
MTHALLLAFASFERLVLALCLMSKRLKAVRTAQPGSTTSVTPAENNPRIN